MKRSQVPAFGSWDCNDEDLQFTQCFETARPTGLLRYSYSGDRDLYVAGDLYQNHIVTPAMIVVPRRPRAKKEKHVKEEKKERYMVCEYGDYDAKAATQTQPTTKKNKAPTVAVAVDEDLYKISPDLLYAQTKKSPEESKSVAVTKKVMCLCAPTTHPGSFKCRYHRAITAQKSMPDQVSSAKKTVMVFQSVYK